jgi:hypothetical protein
MNRDDVQRIVLGARTPAECRAATEVLRRWMREHPADQSALEGGEQLAVIAAGHGEPEASVDGSAGMEFDPASAEADAQWGVTFADQVSDLVEALGWDEATARAEVEDLRRRCAPDIALRRRALAA